MSRPMLIATNAADFLALSEEGLVRGFPVARGGLAPPEIIAMLGALASRISAEFSPAAWLVVENGEVAGLLSCKTVPDESGVVEVGYGVAASRQGEGIARRALGDLIHWARGRADVNAVLAETSPENVASQRVLERNGFTCVGRRYDEEDGELLRWRVDVR
jgi:RimJ/RimL family protein N-acetyltransferase